MSYILDALKKIEHEKNNKRSDGRRSITNDLFQERKQPAARTGLWKIAALIIVVSLIAGGGSWFVFRGKSSVSTVVAQPQAAPPAGPALLPVVAPPAPPAPMPAQTVAPAIVPPAVPTLAAPPVPQNNAAADGDVDPPLSSRGTRPTAPVKAQPVVQQQPVQTVPAPADIKLSGIAWQDERSGRRAVINGFLLKEGATVSGAKIIDIQADRVRFSTAGGQFEIRLDGILPAEIKK